MSDPRPVYPPRPVKEPIDVVALRQKVRKKLAKALARLAKN